MKVKTHKTSLPLIIKYIFKLSKNFKTKKIQILKTVLAVFLIVTTFNCKKDDPEPSVTAPSVSYEENTIDPTYYMAGSSTPTVDWNGDVGTFELLGSVPELSIDANTGKLNWTRNLGEGIWNFDVKATNSAGSTIIEMTLDNTLDVPFIGTYDGTTYFKVIFNKDHTVIIEAHDSSSPNIATGTWSINNDNIIIVNYTYSNGEQYSLKGTLNGDHYEGNWYWYFDALDANIENVFSVQYNT